MRHLLPLLLVVTACAHTRELDELRGILRSTEEEYIVAQAIANNVNEYRKQRDDLRVKEAAFLSRDAVSLLSGVQAAFPRAAIDLRNETDGATALSFTANDPSRAGLAGLQILATSAPFLVLERVSIAGPNVAAALRTPPAVVAPTARAKRGPVPYPPEEFLSSTSERAAIKERIEKYRRDMLVFARINGEVTNVADEIRAIEARLVEGNTAGRLGAVTPLVVRLLAENALLAEGAFEVKPGAITITGKLAPDRTQAELLAALGAFGSLKAISVTDTIRVELESKP